MLYDLVIIGGGPASIAAGIYAARRKINTLLIAKGFGGQMAKKSMAIENYPGFESISGAELFDRFEKHLRAQKIEIFLDEVERIEKADRFFRVLTAGQKEFSAKSVIVAAGGKPRTLDVVGEEEFIGRGLSYCTVCDGPLFSGKVVAVIGGGNSGFEAAMFLSKIAKKVYILESGSNVKADQANQEAAGLLDNIEIITSVRLKEIRGDKFVKSIVYENLTQKKEIILEVGGVFAEIGLVPAASFVGDLVDFNEKGEILIAPGTGQTKTPGLFAAGDITNVKYKQIVIAAGQGAVAALAADDYLQEYGAIH